MFEVVVDFSLFFLLDVTNLGCNGLCSVIRYELFIISLTMIASPSFFRVIDTSSVCCCAPLCVLYFTQVRRSS